MSLQDAATPLRLSRVGPGGPADLLRTRLSIMFTCPRSEPTIKQEDRHTWWMYRCPSSGRGYQLTEREDVIDLLTGHLDSSSY